MALRLPVLVGLFAGVEGTADELCQAAVYPNAFGNTAAPYNANGGTTAQVACPSATPAVKTSATGNNEADDNGGLTHFESICCKTAVACSTTYKANGATGTGTECGTDTILQSSTKCYTVNTAGDACGAQDSTWDSAIDTPNCCRYSCNGASGFELFGGSDAAKQKCDDGDFRVAPSPAVCATGTCAASDKSTCCQKKCSTGVVLNGATVTSPADVACASADADMISTTAYCTGPTCATTDTQCCLNKCADGYELFGGTTSGKRQCGDGERVSPDRYCAGPSCASTDDATCCETKCDKAASGFELHGGSTTGMSQCAKDLRVHPTEYCDGQDCSTHSGVCCQQKCTAGFKLKGATGTGTECAKDLTVHATGYCAGSSCAASDAGTCCQEKCSKGWKLNGATTKESNTCPKDTTLASDGKCAGSPCAAADDKLCCNEKCTDKKKGFKVHKGTGKEPNECKKGEIVSSKGMCKGDCSSDDASTCCLKANNSTATTDANSAGLAAVVGMLIVLSAAS